jgi:hypothetical protein
MSLPRSWCRRWLPALLLGLAACSVAAQDLGVKVSGSLRSLWVDSRTVAGEPYDLSLTRARVEMQGPVAPGIAIDLQVDQEVILGSYLRTTEFQSRKDMPPPQYWRAEGNSHESGDVYARHKLHRGSVRLSHGPVDATLGRQRIAWGTGRFWSPLDILNPVSPLAVERDERLGVDALLVEWKTGPLSRVSAVYAPAPDRRSPGRALLWHGNAAGIDATLVAGRFGGRKVLGADLATQWAQAGVRAELARFGLPDGTGFNRALLGLDYAFNGGLTLSGELFYNGGGTRDPRRHDLIAGSHGTAEPLATRYAGFYANCEFTPLLKWVNYAVRNIDDRSGGLDSRLVWSWRPDVDLSVGVQRFRGPRHSEYGRMPSAVFAQGQWFF